MKIRIMRALFTAMLMALLASCTQPTVSNPEPEILSAIAFVEKTYPGTVVEKLDAKSIGVIWESGAEDVFENLRASVKKDFGVDTLIIATE